MYLVKVGLLALIVGLLSVLEATSIDVDDQDVSKIISNHEEMRHLRKYCHKMNLQFLRTLKN